MAVTIRLKRLGRRNRPFYRIAVMDVRTRRDGSAIDLLGHYDPHVTDDAKRVVLDVERARHWISKGAKPSATVRSFIRAAGITIPWETEDHTKQVRARRRKARASRRKGKGLEKGPQPTAAHMKKKKAADAKDDSKKKLSRAEKKQIEKAGG